MARGSLVRALIRAAASSVVLGTFLISAIESDKEVPGYREGGKSVECLVGRLDWGAVDDPEGSAFGTV